METTMPSTAQGLANRVVGLNTNWLNGNASTTSTNAVVGNTLWPYMYLTYTGRIRLTLSEVQKLRAAAKRDKTVKAILQKFTDYIELVVDFE